MNVLTINSESNAVQHNWKYVSNNWNGKLHFARCYIAFSTTFWLL